MSYFSVSFTGHNSDFSSIGSLTKLLFSFSFKIEKTSVKSKVCLMDCAVIFEFSFLLYFENVTKADSRDVGRARYLVSFLGARVFLFYH